MKLNEYKRKRALYAEFAEAVKNIISSALSSSLDIGGYQYHLQQIQCRAKTFESLAKRLEEKGLSEADNVEEIRNDLAGCRIIFYYNNDVNAFLKSGLIRDNFKVHWDKSRIHGPNDAPKLANDYYTANHYIIELNEVRASLPEYIRFKGLKCELQVQTVLNHAWAETAHDITYKKPEKSSFGHRVLEALDERLKNIMEKFLKPAGYEFQKIQHDRQRLLEGKKLLNRNLKQEIIDCSNNNERYEILERYREYTLPLYDDDYLRSEFDTILKLVETSIFKAREIKPIEIEAPMGSFPGKASKDILNICLQILNYIRFVHVESVFTCFITLYCSSPDEQENKLIKESIVELVKYDIDVLKKAGFFVQEVVVGCLEKLDTHLIIQIKEIIAEIGRCILDPTTKSFLSDYQTFTVGRGSVPGNAQIESIRQRMLNIIIKNYDYRDPKNIKRQMILAFKAATRTSSMCSSNDELLTIILKNCITIIHFYMALIEDEQYDILESIESDICFLYRRAVDIIEGNNVKNDQCLDHCRQFKERAIKFRDKLNKNNEYVVYKTLVGFESVFNESWVNSEWDIRGKKEYREFEIQKYVDNFDKNSDFWEKIIIRCAKTESKDMATFPLFGKYLNLLSAKHPEFIFNLIICHEESLMRFSCAILDGLLKSNFYKNIVDKMNQWVEQGKYLSDCARVFEYHQPIDNDLLNKIFTIAKKNDDYSALIKLMAVSAKNYTRESLSIIKTLFIPALQELTRLKSSRWVSDFWDRPETKEIISILDEQETKILLDNLILEQIDFYVEEILALIAEKYPKVILDFFRSRLSVENKNGKHTRHYDAIPFNFHQLDASLSKHPELIIDTVCSWYEDDDQLFVFHGTKLINNIFPHFPKELEGKLAKLVKTGQERNIRIVVAILHNYDGKPVINNICKQIVAILPEDSNLLSQIEKILQNTGVLKGEFGRVNALKQKIADISSWLKERNKKVKTFAKKYILGLEKQIINEQRRAEEDIESRKHQFGNLRPDH